MHTADILLHCILHSADSMLKYFQEELDYAPDWLTKARYRRGQAQKGKQNYDLALRDLLAVQKLQPNDNGVKKEIADLKKSVQAFKEKEKKMYGKMFG